MCQIAANPSLRLAFIYLAILVLGLLPLTFNVIRNRRDAKVGILDGGNKQLSLAIRVHGNYAENVPSRWLCSLRWDLLAPRHGPFIWWALRWSRAACLMLSACRNLPASALAAPLACF